MRPRPGRMAGTHRGDRADHARGDGRQRCAAGRRQFLLRRSRPSRVGKMLEQRHQPLSRSPAPTGNTSRPNRSPTALSIDVTGGEQDCELAELARMIEMKAVDIVQPDICYLGGLTRTLRVADMAHQGRPAVHAALRQPVDGDAVHHAPAARHPECRQVSRILDRGRRLLSLAGRPLRRLALRDCRWQGDGDRRARLGCRGHPAWLEQSKHQISSLGA
jgi:hypothetical protein